MKVAIIGGSGVYNFGQKIERKNVSTEYGSVDVDIVETNGHEVVFVSRHGAEHTVPPHKINYRANIAAIKMLGVRQVLATNAVGGIAKACEPGALIIPDQIIDYTSGREHTFFDTFSSALSHIDFTEPFDDALRSTLLDCIKTHGLPFVEGGVYGCVQGPRLETAAEVQRYRRDGCTVLGMTGMPEASLAKEANLAYASICFSVNWAAGLSGPLAMQDIVPQIEQCTSSLKLVLSDAVTMLSS